MENRLSGMDACNIDPFDYTWANWGNKQSSSIHRNSLNSMDLSIFICTILYEIDLYPSAAAAIL